MVDASVSAEYWMRLRGSGYAPYVLWEDEVSEDEDDEAGTLSPGPATSTLGVTTSDHAPTQDHASPTADDSYGQNTWYRIYGALGSIRSCYFMFYNTPLFPAYSWS